MLLTSPALMSARTSWNEDAKSAGCRWGVEVRYDSAVRRPCNSLEGTTNSSIYRGRAASSSFTCSTTVESTCTAGISGVDPVSSAARYRRLGSERKNTAVKPGKVASTPTLEVHSIHGYSVAD